MSQNTLAESVELCIIGAGPAGLSAAISAGRAGIATKLFGRTPKFAADYEIDNYYGFPETIMGRDLHERGLAQAARFGVPAIEEQVLGLHMAEKGFEVVTAKSKVLACAVILATGVARNRPKIAGLSEFEGKGVSYCVTCDGFFFKNKPVVALGEGNYAASQALELLNYTPHVTLCLHGKKPAIDEDFAARLKEAKVAVAEQAVERLEGENGLDRLVFKDGSTLEAHGLFVAMGEASGADFAQSLGLQTSGAYIEADHEQATNIPGIFAAGDCTGGFLQISTAVGEGALAARAAIAYVKKHCR